MFWKSGKFLKLILSECRALCISIGITIHLTLHLAKSVHGQSIHVPLQIVYRSLHAYMHGYHTPTHVTSLTNIICRVTPCMHALEEMTDICKHCNHTSPLSPSVAKVSSWVGVPILPFFLLCIVVRALP